MRRVVSQCEPSSAPEGDTVQAAIETCRGRFSVVEVELPGCAAENAGVLLEDPAADRLYLRFRRDWDSIAEEEDAEVLAALAVDLAQKAAEMGAGALLSYFEDRLSNTLRVSDRRAVLVDDFERTVNRLYREHIHSRVVPFRTHIPRYSLQVAAGKFLENAEVTEEGWVETPEGMAVHPDLFAARIVGHSMEPQIPDGSLCVFRAGVTGSRQGRLVLVEDSAAGGVNRYTVKRYTSEKSVGESGWRHTRIHLQSLNPQYPSWDLDPEQDQYRVIAEFQRVME
jgi:hypothetical protein